MSSFIPLSVPNFIGNERKYVDDVVTREWVSTGGKEIEIFEENFSKYIGVKKAVACQSGTAGLHLAYKLSGIEADTEVIVPDLTFIASVNPIKYLNADPIFIDCDDTLNMDIDKLEKFIKNHCSFIDEKLINNSTNKIVKAIVIVHIFGNLINMERVMALAEKYALKVIEDATEALGSYYLSEKYKGQFAGTIGDFGVFSFNGNKIITTGGGGMIVSKYDDLLDKAKYLSTQAKDDVINFVHNEIGYNYRMTNLQAALGIAQLENLEKFIKIKNENYAYYKKKIDKIAGLSLLEFNDFGRHNKWFYSLLVDSHIFGYSIKELIECLQENNIQARPIWGLMHNQNPYQACESFEIEKAEYYKCRVINIPCSTNLTFDDIDRVVDGLTSIQKG